MSEFQRCNEIHWLQCSHAMGVLLIPSNYLINWKFVHFFFLTLLAIPSVFFSICSWNALWNIEANFFCYEIWTIDWGKKLSQNRLFAEIWPYESKQKYIGWDWRVKFAIFGDERCPTKSIFKSHPALRKSYSRQKLFITMKKHLE